MLPAIDRPASSVRRYVVRVSNKVNVNIRLVAVGAATPWIYDGEIGRHAARMDKLAKNAIGKKLGLRRACPGTKYDPYEAIETHPVRRKSGKSHGPADRLLVLFGLPWGQVRRQS